MNLLKSELICGLFDHAKDRTIFTSLSLHVYNTDSIYISTHLIKLTEVLS